MYIYMCACAILYYYRGQTRHVYCSIMQNNPLTVILLKAHMTQSFKMKKIASKTDTSEMIIPLMQCENRLPQEKQPPKLTRLLESM